MSRTYALLHLSPDAYTEIRDKLIRGGYETKLLVGGNIDMEGIAIAREVISFPPPPREVPARADGWWERLRRAVKGS